MTAAFAWRTLEGGSGAGFGCLAAHRDGGSLDEAARRLSHEELRVAETLAGEGHAVRALAETRRGGRQADLEVCGGRVEVKSFDSLDWRGGRPPSARAVANKLLDASGQAERVVLSGYGSGLTAETVRRGLLRLARDRPGVRLHQVRALGDGFDLSWSRVPVRTAARPTGTGLDGRPRLETGLAR